MTPPASPHHADDRRARFEQEALPWADALLAYALRLTAGDRAQAEDLVQEAMLAAYRSWHTYRPGTNCRAWLMTILHNHAVSVFRRRARWESDLDLDEVADRTIFERVQTVDPEGRFFAGLIDGEVIDAIDALPAPHREVLVLSDLHDLSYAEIADVAGIPVGTVKSRLFRARQALQSRLYDFAVRSGYIAPPPSEPDLAGCGIGCSAGGTTPGA